MIQILSKYGQMLLFAMGQTLLLALWGLFFACILGMIFGLLSVVRNKVCNVIASIFVDVIRGVPMIVLAYFIFFGLPYAFKNFLDSKMTLTALQAWIPLHLRLTAVPTWLRSFVPVSSQSIRDRWRLQEVLDFHTGVPWYASYFRRQSVP